MKFKNVRVKKKGKSARNERGVSLRKMKKGKV